MNDDLIDIVATSPNDGEEGGVGPLDDQPEPLDFIAEDSATNNNHNNNNNNSKNGYGHESMGLFNGSTKGLELGLPSPISVDSKSITFAQSSALHALPTVSNNESNNDTNNNFTNNNHGFNTTETQFYTNNTTNNFHNTNGTSAKANMHNNNNNNNNSNKKDLWIKISIFGLFLFLIFIVIYLILLSDSLVSQINSLQSSIDSINNNCACAASSSSSSSSSSASSLEETVSNDDDDDDNDNYDYSSTLTPTSNPTEMGEEYMWTSTFGIEATVFTFEQSKDQVEAGDTQVTGHEWDERYYHIFTPLKSSDTVMFRYNLVGYSYGIGQALDLVWVGYNYAGTNDFVHKYTHDIFDNSGSSLDAYYQTKTENATNNITTMVLKFGPIKRYFNGFELRYMGFTGSNVINGYNTNEYYVKITANDTQF